MNQHTPWTSGSNQLGSKNECIHSPQQPPLCLPRGNLADLPILKTPISPSTSQGSTSCYVLFKTAFVSRFQNYGLSLGTMAPYYMGSQQTDPDFDKYPSIRISVQILDCWIYMRPLFTLFAPNAEGPDT